MGRGRTISVTEDMAIGATNVDILRNLTSLTKLAEDSVVAVYLVGESVDVTAAVKMGNFEAMSSGPIPIDTTVGQAPTVPDDRMVLTDGENGETISIPVSNANAAAQSCSAIVRIIPAEDLLAFPQLLETL